MTVRLARADDVPRLAELHATRMTEGFLSALGPRFLRILYRRIVASSDAFAHVAEEPIDGTVAVVGFAAASLDVSDLYRRFVLRDGVIAGIAAAPRLLGSWRQVLETLRYPAGTDDLPDAEILSVAVDPRATGRGVGAQVVDAATGELTRRGVTAAKVVTGADNVAALALYERCGFVCRAQIAVHEGTPSEVLVWSSS
ncbi:MAG: GNAT family N-acetyltransferase [Acidimicrobiia bacterium]